MRASQETPEAVSSPAAVVHPLRRPLRVQHETKGQATGDAQGDGVRLGNEGGKRFEPEGEGLWRVLTTVAALADEDRGTLMCRGGGDILRKVVTATLQPDDVPGQLPKFAPSQELLVGVVLFKDGETL